MTSSEPPVQGIAETAQIRRVLEIAGIADGFINKAGEMEHIPFANRLRVLELMGVDAGSQESLRLALRAAFTDRYGRLLPHCPVVDALAPACVPLYLPENRLETPIQWRVVTEQGQVLEGRLSGSGMEHLERLELEELVFDCRGLPLPGLPEGYHRLQVALAGEEHEARLIAAPGRCHEPEWSKGGAKLAGMSLHLYTLASPRNWGIGDFTDLATFLGYAADAGLDFVALNPLHTLDSLEPDQCSPYRPLDRRFLNPLYIDPEREPEFRDNADLRDYLARPALQSRLGEMRGAPLVDYPSVNHIKFTVLSKMFKHFRRCHLDAGTRRGRAFLDWAAQQGAALQAFADFQAGRNRLSLHMSRHSQFHVYLQWLAEQQLAACQQLALARGMRIGLVRGLAVGSDCAGPEVGLQPELFSAAASIGAPPDPLDPRGQNWGLAPMRPAALSRSGYRHLIDLLRDNMSHCGALRIDHMMSLTRLWWCPRNGHGHMGAYVRYPAEALFGILRLESRRNRCMIIGEDLGLASPELRRLMHDGGIYSNTLFYPEKEDATHFRAPHRFRSRTLAMVGSHEAPTLAAWWSKYDLNVRKEIGLPPDPSVLDLSIRHREEDLINVLRWLDDLKLLPPGWKDFNIHRVFDVDLCRAILAAIGGSAAQLVSVQPEDICLMREPFSVPGSQDEYPNWRRKLTVSIDALFNGTDHRSMLSALTDARRSG